MNRAQPPKGSPINLQLPYMLRTMRELEIEEQIAEARAAKEERELLLRTAFAFAPSFHLQHIVRRWWIAAIDEPLERIAKYFMNPWYRKRRTPRICSVFGEILLP